MALAEKIKKLIPHWLAPTEVDRLRKPFDRQLDRTEFIRRACSQKNWKLLSKVTHGPKTSRVFGCKSLGDRLRCYVVDDGEGNIIEHRFETE